MPVKRKITEPDGVYFITITCRQWLSLIEQVKGYDLIYKWFDHLKEKGHFITGYVIMPNHLHALIAFRNTGQSINTIIGNGKRFMAYEIIKRLELRGATRLLHNLNLAVEAKDMGNSIKLDIPHPLLHYSGYYNSLEKKYEGTWRIDPIMFKGKDNKYYKSGSSTGRWEMSRRV